MLKPYNELRKVDVTPFCETRKAKDDKGREIDVAYLNWAKCVDLLHEHGATTVYFIPVRTAEGSYLISSKEVSNKDGKKTGCYFVAVDIVIDDLRFGMDYPLMNGTYVVYDDTLNQLRISNAHARAFVKGVAIRTGLGFDLWIKGGEEEVAAKDDLSYHSMLSIKRRVEETLTAKIQRGMSESDIASSLNINVKQLKSLLETYDKLHAFELALNKL